MNKCYGTAVTVQSIVEKMQWMQLLHLPVQIFISTNVLFRQVGEHVSELRLVIFAPPDEAEEHLPVDTWQNVSRRQSGADYQTAIGAVSGKRAVPADPVSSHVKTFVWGEK